MFQLLFVIYMGIVAILLVNMLIAMMGNTYQKIAETRNEWQRQVIGSWMTNHTSQDQVLQVYLLSVLPISNRTMLGGSSGTAFACPIAHISAIFYVCSHTGMNIFKVC
jgi:hypothetical protein